MPFSKAGAAIVALTLGVATALAVPTSASAHNGTLDAKSVCASDGTRVITYTGTTENVPVDGAGHTAKLTVVQIEPKGTTVTPATQTISGNVTYSFTQVVPGDTTYSQAVALLEWGDRVADDPIGELTFTDTCAPKDKEDAKVGVSVTKATCAGPGVASFTIENATWDDPNDITDGSRTATADPGHVFDDKKPTRTVTYTIPSQLDPNATECAPDLTPTVTVVEQLDCLSTIVNITTTTTTPTYTLQGTTWTRGADDVQVANTTRPLTPAEVLTCTPPVVTPTVTTSEAFVCESSSATVTTTTTTPTFTWNGSQWVPAADDVQVTTSSRPLTAAEVTTCPPPPVVPPVVPPVTTVVLPPTVVPPTTDVCPNLDGEQTEVPSGRELNDAGNCAVKRVVLPPTNVTDTETVDELAVTGFDDEQLAGIALLALLTLLAGAGILVGRRVNTRRSEG